MRTEQDNNITIYSFAELEVMLVILDNKNSTSYVPFSRGEIENEINKRLS